MGFVCKVLKENGNWAIILIHEKEIEGNSFGFLKLATFKELFIHEHE